MIQEKLRSLRNRVSGRTAIPTDAAPQNPLELQKTIEKKAYEIFQQRGQKNGNALEDWLQAEKAILGSAHKARKTSK